MRASAERHALAPVAVAWIPFKPLWFCCLLCFGNDEMGAALVWTSAAAQGNATSRFQSAGCCSLMTHLGTCVAAH